MLEVKYNYDYQDITNALYASEGKTSSIKLISEATAIYETNTAYNYFVIANSNIEIYKIEVRKGSGSISDIIKNFENGRKIYEVEFYTVDGKEYDYEIDASTGEVVSYDYDAESFAPPASQDNKISAQKAKELALAQVPGASESDIWEFDTDYDDGRIEYEGKIIYDGMEYEFEIDAYSGAFRSWEAEPIDS